MKSTSIILILSAFFSLTSCVKQKEDPTQLKLIGTLGDSITRGDNSVNIAIALAELVPEGYHVSNYAVSGTCLVKNCFSPIWETSNFKKLVEDEPDIITIMLGTNDANSTNSDEVRAKYERDYKEMIELFQSFKSKPKLLLCYPPPIFAQSAKSDSIIKHELIPIIDKLADIYGLNVADTHYLVDDYPINYPDSLHPNENGVAKLASIMSNALGL